MGNFQSFLILGILIALIYIFDRKNFKKEATLMYLRRTERGLGMIDKFGRAHEKSFKFFGDVGIILSFGALGSWFVFKTQKKKHSLLFSFLTFILLFPACFVFLSLYLSNLVLMTGASLIFASTGASGIMFFLLFYNGIKIFTKEVMVSTLRIVLPVEVPEVPFVLSVPIGYWLLAIFVILIAHEFSHALVARAERIKVNSLGYGFLAILPLGFAEPDEKQLKKTEAIKKTRVYAAGSLANVIVAFLIFISLFFVSPFLGTFEPRGAHYSSLMEGMPAVGVLPSDGVITQINGFGIKTAQNMSDVMDGIKANESISLIVNGNEYKLKTTYDPSNESRAFIGVYDVRTDYPALFTFIVELGWWLFILNLGIGLANLMPIKTSFLPLDGGMILEEIIKNIKISKSKLLFNYISTLTFLLVLFNIFGSKIMALIAI